jgi:FKBP-type peptidyl-prolyl cis-trans isomerase FklB
MLNFSALARSEIWVERWHEQPCCAMMIVYTSYLTGFPMKHFFNTSLVIAGLLPFAVAAADLTSDKQKFSYALGAQIGGNVKQQGIELDADAFAAGIHDVISDVDLQLTADQMQQAAENYQQELMAKREAEAGTNEQRGREFRARNKQESGVEELDGGLQYKVIESGSGKQPESVEDTVVVHYRGTLIDGTEFDSSHVRGEPATFQINEVIEGWQKALPQMQEGDKWQIVIPPELAYGEQGAGTVIGPNETLVFEIELIEVK